MEYTIASGRSVNVISPPSSLSIERVVRRSEATRAHGMLAVVAVESSQVRIR
jgi:hypothetical protein